MVEDNITPFVPAGMAQTQLLTQRHLDEAARALGRPLWDYEVKILDELMTVQTKVNRKLYKLGRAHATHSLDELISLFVSRVQSKAAQQVTEVLMSDHKEKKAKVYKELSRIANAT